MAVTVRPATPADASILAMLNRDVQQLHANAIPDLFSPPTDTDEEVAAEFRDALARPDNRLYIATLDGEPAGYLVCEVTRLPADTRHPPREWVYIHQISVNRTQRGQGIGTALINAAFDLARAEGITRVALDTWAFNEQAQRFFAKHGFQVFNLRMDVHLD